MSIVLSACPLARNVRAKVNPRVADTRPCILGGHFISYARVFPRRNVSIKVSACPPSQNTKLEVTRQTANFCPSIWGDHFINYAPDDKITRAYKEQQVEDLKEEVRRVLMAAADNPSLQLNYLDAVQQLGLAYHFEREIEEALQRIYDNSHDGDDIDDDLYNVALRFRLLRQQGFNISCDIFRKFKDEKGRFKESLNSNVQGILGLYEASHLRVWDEDILDEALVFTTNYLKSAVEHLDYPLAEQVAHALKQPIRKGLNRLEARWYMSIYQDEASHDKALLKLAKLDFNLMQSLHKEELSNIARWWKELDFATKLPFARDRLVELYFCVLGIFFEPKYLRARRITTQVLAMATILDDIYDAYGTFEELKLFTEAIERWDANSIDQLPEYMQVFYAALLDVYKEFEQEMDKEGKAYCVHYAQEAMKIQVRAYFDETKWFHEGYVPTVEEYMHVAVITSGFPMLTTISFMAMGEIITKEVFDWVFNDPLIKASSVILRLMDDMASYKFEQERGHVASSIECYMKQYGVSELQAHDEFQKQVVNAWKDINKGCLRPTSIRMPLLMCVLNLARLADLNYKEKDDYTHVGKLMKENIASLLIDPVIV